MLGWNAGRFCGDFETGAALLLLPFPRTSSTIFWRSPAKFGRHWPFLSDSNSSTRTCEAGSSRDTHSDWTEIFRCRTLLLNNAQKEPLLLFRASVAVRRHV
ncbi:uncharacterized protein ASCRUDRAFT_139529 [Ascoidea rubescens DSM 1968]|uniref:Uncharacterized protein n=1 Tax=Ascoidea rubescens DSM 1968 TaxID=1344418 RepID=A0A1D2VK35_9ASCO|nr:hypothetical protein ASCRUDRAFT_139529 [Ascoidea rubescens DSM 1968]ODV61964.1 hypothetical protein ASCRUDRAFT_139529 [Ascoidea rubescens DSM 1968]